jgi:hypothetical protein
MQCLAFSFGPLLIHFEETRHRFRRVVKEKAFRSSRAPGRGGKVHALNLLWSPGVFSDGLTPDFLGL